MWKMGEWRLLSWRNVELGRFGGGDWWIFIIFFLVVL